VMSATAKPMKLARQLRFSVTRSLAHPLKGVNAPDGSLGEDAVLGQRNQLT
jgi:hypothetical protein